MSGGPAVAVPPPDRLPDGTAVRLDPRVRRRDGGTTLLGGSPLRLVRLQPRARDLLHGDRLVVRDATTATLAARLLDAGLAHPEPDGVPAGELTVVVPVKDRPAELDRLLTALRADPQTAGAPVLVVDDGSADPAAVTATADRHRARVLRHATARGPAAARNAGMRAATTDLVAFLDSDCVPLPGWSSALARHTADPRLALVAPRITALPADGGGWVEPYEAAVSALDMGPHPAPVAPGTAVPYLPSAAMVARRHALGDGFDESMRVAEDVDLVWRLVAAGWRVRYEPSGAVAHEHRPAPGEHVRRPELEPAEREAHARAGEGQRRGHPCRVDLQAQHLDVRPDGRQPVGELEHGGPRGAVPEVDDERVLRAAQEPRLRTREPAVDAPQPVDAGGAAGRRADRAGGACPAPRARIRRRGHGAMLPGGVRGGAVA